MGRGKKQQRVLVKKKIAFAPPVKTKEPNLICIRGRLPTKIWPLVEKKKISTGVVTTHNAHHARRSNLAHKKKKKKNSGLVWGGGGSLALTKGHLKKQDDLVPKGRRGGCKRQISLKNLGKKKALGKGQEVVQATRVKSGNRNLEPYRGRRT